MNIELMKKRRKELGMTQQDLADKCGLSRVSISNYESGKAEPTYDNIELLSKVLSLDVIELITSSKTNFIPEQNFDNLIEKMQENLITFIRNTISKNIKSNNIDIEGIPEEILFLINDFTNTTAVLSTVVDRVVFFNTNTQTFSMCHLEVFENYILNLFYISNTIVKNTTDLTAMQINTIFENEFRTLEISDEIKSNNEMIEKLELELESLIKLNSFVNKISNKLKDKVFLTNKKKNLKQLLIEKQ